MSGATKPMEREELDSRMEHPLAAALKGEARTWTEACLLPERMIALAEHTLPEPEAERLMAHVALCARCRPEYAETVELIQLAGDVRELERQVGDVASTASTPIAADPAPRRDRLEAAQPERMRQPTRSWWRTWFTPAFGFSL